MWLWIPYLIAGAMAIVAWWFWRRSEALERAAAQALRENAEARQSCKAELAKTQAAQATVFNSMVEGLLILEADGRVRFANPTAVRLLSLPNPLPGRTLLEATRRHELQELFVRAQTEGKVTGFELFLPHSTRVLQINGASLGEPGPAAAEVVLVLHDLTRLKQLESMRQEFVANVSHELRTPLSLIKGYAETLLDGAKEDPAILTRFLKTIEKHADRLTLLIEDLLTISSLESGQIALHRQNIGLREAADQVISQLTARAAERRVSLVNDLPETLLANADGDRIEQVLFNLVDNAIKYGREGGRVRISGGEVVGGVEVSVADDGPGIAPEVGDRVFERFFRVDRARSREQGGTGLGLSIVKHIIQAHGGEIRLSPTRGGGATFSYTLPGG